PPHTIGRGFLYRDLAVTINARGGQGDLEEAVRLSELAINSWPYTRERQGCWDSAFVILISYYESTNQMQKLQDTRARCISSPR
ncbi:MAG: hypothetical protein O9325_19415, partial [Roseomonas sp.]|nr:hypothetical protein [Roseomonas sp.]